AASGACFPAYEAIAAKAGCARSTVAAAIKALEACGVLTWVHRLWRERDRVGRWRVLRTSNAYVFRDPRAAGRSSESENQSGTLNQGFYLLRPAIRRADPGPVAAPIDAAEARLALDRVRAARQACLFVTAGG